MDEGGATGEGASSFPNVNWTLKSSQWEVDPDTGIVSLSEDAIKAVVNSDPIEKWYNIDPEPLARGQWTTVYHCIHRVNGQECAAKFSRRRRLGVDVTADLLHEVGVCLLLRESPKVVQLHEIFSTNQDLILVMEFATGGDLQTILDEDLVPYERNVIGFLRQLLEGLVSIHEKNIVHMDIKPQNVVLMGEYPNCTVKLCDFEISRMVTDDHDVREVLGTADYVAPEIIHYEPITSMTDMWSFGVLSYVLLTGFLPFGGDSDQETFLEISKGELDFPEELFEDVSQHAIDFIKRLLVRQPRLRMTAKECLEHEWMKSDLKAPKLPPQPLPLSPLSPLSCSCQPPPKLNPPSTLSFLPSMDTMESTMEKSLAFIESLRSPIVRNDGDDLFSPGRPNLPHIAASPLSPLPVRSPLEASLPPPYPQSRSSTHSSTASLSRGSSRQNLNKLRVISKSREVLYEKLQLSRQKKMMSRSRDRLFDGRFGLGRKENLVHKETHFHSEETLPLFDWLSTEDLIYNSHSSIDIPVFQSSCVMNRLSPPSSNTRLYKSMASINGLNHAFGNESSSDESTLHGSNKSIKEDAYPTLVRSYTPTPKTKKRQGKRARSRRLATIKKQETQNKNNKNNQLQNSVKQRGKVVGDKNIKKGKETKKSKEAKLPASTKTTKTKTVKEIQKGESKGKGQTGSKSVTPMTSPKERNASSPTNGGARDKRRHTVSHIENRIQERHERLIDQQRRNSSADLRTPKFISIDVPQRKRKSPQTVAPLTVSTSKGNRVSTKKQTTKPESPGKEKKGKKQNKKSKVEASSNTTEHSNPVSDKENSATTNKSKNAPKKGTPNKRNSKLSADLKNKRLGKTQQQTKSNNNDLTVCDKGPTEQSKLEKLTFESTTPALEVSSKEVVTDMEGNLKDLQIEDINKNQKSSTLKQLEFEDINKNHQSFISKDLKFEDANRIHEDSNDLKGVKT